MESNLQVKQGQVVSTHDSSFLTSTGMFTYCSDYFFMGSEMAGRAPGGVQSWWATGDTEAWYRQGFSDKESQTFQKL